MKYLDSSADTYAVVILLLYCHILTNYVAVRAVVMRSLNKQRASLLWSAYSRSSLETGEKPAWRRVLSPKEVSDRECLFGRGSAFLNATDPGEKHDIIGYGTFGPPVSRLLNPHDNFYSKFISSLAKKPLEVRDKDEDENWLASLLDLFSNERYIVWPDLRRSSPRFAHILIYLKDGHTPMDHLKAWLNAAELSLSLCSEDVTKLPLSKILETIDGMKDQFTMSFETFVKDVKTVGWDVDGSSLVSGVSRTIEVAIGEDKKNI